MKTLILIVGMPDDPLFMEVEGDYSAYHNVFIEELDDGEGDGLIENIFNANYTKFLHPVCRTPSKDWDFFISINLEECLFPMSTDDVVDTL